MLTWHVHRNFDQVLEVICIVRVYQDKLSFSVCHSTICTISWITLLLHSLNDKITLSGSSHLKSLGSKVSQIFYYLHMHNIVSWKWDPVKYEVHLWFKHNYPTYNFIQYFCYACALTATCHVRSSLSFSTDSIMLPLKKF